MLNIVLYKEEMCQDSSNRSKEWSSPINLKYSLLNVELVCTCSRNPKSQSLLVQLMGSWVKNHHQQKCKGLQVNLNMLNASKIDLLRSSIDQIHSSINQNSRGIDPAFMSQWMIEIVLSIIKTAMRAPINNRFYIQICAWTNFYIPFGAPTQW